MPKDHFLKDTLRNLRRALNYSGLKEKDAAEDPFAQFEVWMKAAVEKEAFEPNAMTLATASKDGFPTARIVLLKDYGPEGFVFYTNFKSRKGENLGENPRASLVFYWASLSRQVLIDGRVERISRETSVEYFHSRPRGSQIAALASAQSRPLRDRDELTEEIKRVKEKYADREIPCPEHWGGFTLLPSRVEFWQGRPDRTHDRLCYTQTPENTWTRQRLAP